MQIFKLKFHSALHVESRGTGEPETAEEFIRSDTLSAAVCLAHEALFQDTGPGFFLDPPFRVSSAFPYIGEVLLYPVPVWRTCADMDEAQRKKFKKVRWISQALFDCVLTGKPIDRRNARILHGTVAISDAEIKAHPELQAGPAWVKDERQRVSVDRLGTPGEGELFFFGLQFFAPHAGLWFQVESRQNHRFRAALDYLGDTGIGADRNSGLGHFRVCGVEPVPAPSDKKREGWFTLSLFNPASDELPSLTRQSAYGIVTRSGWISGSTVGRPPVRAFTEGSYFSASPAGRVVETLDQASREQYQLPIRHSAPRDFRAVAVPCALPRYLKEEEQ